MSTFHIRFNKTRGQAGRGSMDHVWRVFENGKEYLFKSLDITVPVKSEKDANGVDYNIVCTGKLMINRDTSTAHISPSQTVKYNLPPQKFAPPAFSNKLEKASLPE